MTLPRELSLRTVAGRPTLISEPIAGQGRTVYSQRDVAVGPDDVTLPVRPRAYRVHAEFRPGTARRFGVCPPIAPSTRNTSRYTLGCRRDVS